MYLMKYYEIYGGDTLKAKYVTLHHSPDVIAYCELHFFFFFCNSKGSGKDSLQYIFMNRNRYFP